MFEQHWKHTSSPFPVEYSELVISFGIISYLDYPYIYHAISIYIGKYQYYCCVELTASRQAHSTKTSNERTHPSFTSKQHSSSVLVAAFGWRVSYQHLSMLTAVLLPAVDVQTNSATVETYELSLFPVRYSEHAISFDIVSRLSIYHAIYREISIRTIHSSGFHSCIYNQSFYFGTHL